MERDEARTLTVPSSHRLIIDASIAESAKNNEHAWNCVVAEFASVVFGNRTAQFKFRICSPTKKPSSRKRNDCFSRIGINVGDVMMKDGDIFGDGVNIAARLKSLAEPGGICVSRGVREHLRKHPIAFADLGEQKVRNIAQPVRAFKVRMGEAPDDITDPVLEATRVDGPSMAPTTIEEVVGVELAFWDSIKDSGSVAELDAYLLRYPDGAFNVLAQTRRDALLSADENASPSKEEALAVELAFWEAFEGQRQPYRARSVS